MTAPVAAPTTAPVTLITGTRKGIGQFLAHHYVRLGHTVIGCSRELPDWQLDGYEHHLADVADEAAVRQIFSGIRGTHGRLDHLVNNAGIAAMNHSLLTPLSTVNSVLQTNVAGTFLFSREAAKLMMKQKYGYEFDKGRAERVLSGQDPFDETTMIAHHGEAIFMG